jgi:chromosome segregation ATPase
MADTPLTAVEAIAAVQQITRLAQKIAESKVDSALDSVTAVVNHAAELTASIAALQAQKAALEQDIVAAKQLRGQHESATVAAKADAESAKKQLQQLRSQLAQISATIAPLTA